MTVSRDSPASVPCKGVLISDLTRDGSKELLQALSEQFDMRVQPAIWVSSAEMDDSSVVDTRAFEARHLRLPLTGEVGTALAHRAAYQQLLDDDSDIEWWVIFEDDAHLLHPGDFADRVYFLSSILDVTAPTIVNLSHKAAQRAGFLSRGTDIDDLWLPIVPTYTATAYLLNRSAAQLLLQAQTPIRSQPDWPIDCRSVLFYQESRKLVEPRSSTESVADPTGLRAVVPHAVHLQTWSWLWYMRHRKEFSRVGDYWHQVLLPRLMRHIYRS